MEEIVIKDNKNLMLSHW